MQEIGHVVVAGGGVEVEVEVVLAVEKVRQPSTTTHEVPSGYSCAGLQTTGQEVVLDTAEEVKLVTEVIVVDSGQGVELVVEESVQLVVATSTLTLCVGVIVLVPSALNGFSPRHAAKSLAQAALFESAAERQELWSW